MTRAALAALSLSLVALALSMSPARAVPTQQYDHGDPSGDEQYLLELINRARANPSAEGSFLLNTGDSSVGSALTQFNVDTARLLSDFNSYSARPPVAFNPALSNAAERHGVDLIASDSQDHTGSDNSTPGSRVTDAGYAFSFVRENVYSYAQSPLYAHAAFNIDWGPNESTGVQNWPLPGHRQAIMNFRPLGSPSTNSTAEPLLTEVGMSWLSAPNRPTVGPNVLVQDFATSTERFLLGVVYDDLDNDGFYTPGEGLPGVRITPSVGDWFAVSSNSGGYAIPIAALGAGTIDVVASSDALGTVGSRTISLTGNNAKVDFEIDVSATPAPTSTTSSTTSTTAAPTTTAAPVTLPVDTTPVAPTPTTELLTISVVVEETTTTTTAPTAPSTTLAEIQVLQVQTMPTTTESQQIVVLETTTDPPTTTPASITTGQPTTTIAPPTSVAPATTTPVDTVPETTVPSTTGTVVDTPVQVLTTDATAATVLGVSTDRNDADASIGSTTSTIGIDLAADQTLPITGPQPATQMTLIGLAVLAAGLNLLVGSRQPV